MRTKEEIANKIRELKKELEEMIKSELDKFPNDCYKVFPTVFPEFNQDTDIWFSRIDKEKPISDMKNERQCIDEIFEALKAICNKKEYGILHSYQIIDATMSALYILMCSW